MGAGKSTTGKCLAEMIGYDFVDLDAEVVKQEGRSIKQIFLDDGETHFRDCESALLEKIASEKPAIIATGGGIVLRDANRSQMQRRGVVVYLDAQWETLKDRLLSSRDRPLVNPEGNWDEVKQRWIDRQEFYRNADYVVSTDNLSPRQVAIEIKALIEAGQLP